MTYKTPDPDAIDRWLRNALEPETEAARRISSRALESRARSTRLAIRPLAAALAGAVLVAVLLISIWTRHGGTPPPARESIRITNFGELVAAVDPSGAVWMHSPDRPTYADSPRLIITLGAEDED